MLERARVLENSADDIRETYRQCQTYDIADSSLPTHLSPYKVDDKQIERNPHRSARYGCHCPIHYWPTIEVEPQEKIVVESVHSF